MGHTRSTNWIWPHDRNNPLLTQNTTALYGGSVRALQNRGRGPIGRQYQIPVHAQAQRQPKAYPGMRRAAFDAGLLRPSATQIPD